MRNIADACRYIVAGAVASYQQFGFGLYLVALKETAVPIGICGLLKREIHEGHRNRFCVSGTLLGEGICVRVGGGDGLRANFIGLKRIAATTAPGNRCSIRVLEKLGLRFEGRLRLPGQETSLYALEG